MSTERLMGRIGKGGHGWTSRDYNVDIPCKCTTCPNNIGKKIQRDNPYCMMPSAIKINAAGVCQTGLDLKAEETPKPLKPVDGD